MPAFQIPHTKRLTDIPGEIHLEIQQLIYSKDLKKLMRTCRKLYQIYGYYRWRKVIVIGDSYYNYFEPPQSTIIPLSIFMRPKAFCWLHNTAIEVVEAMWSSVCNNFDCSEFCEIMTVEYPNLVGPFMNCPDGFMKLTSQNFITKLLERKRESQLSIEN